MGNLGTNFWKNEKNEKPNFILISQMCNTCDALYRTHLGLKKIVGLFENEGTLH